MSVHDRSALWDTRTRVFMPHIPPYPPPPPPPPVTEKSLNVHIPQQEQSNWCWVAVGSGIASFYDGTVYPQCYVVTIVFTKIHSGFNTNCCSPTVDASQMPCNAESGADQALDNPRHHFAGNVLSPLDLAEITNQIDQGRPFAAGINWAGGGAHFVAITGYLLVGTEHAPYVEVQDPASRSSSVYTLRSFTSSYEGNGTWGWTTLSQP